LKPSGNLLIGFSGGLGSAVLLDLVHRCYYSEEGKITNEEKGGRDAPRNSVWSKVFVCYVEPSEAYPGMRNRTDEIHGLLKVYPEFEFIPLRLSNAFDEEWWDKMGGKPSHKVFATDLLNEDTALSISEMSQSPTERLNTYLSSLPTQTSFQTSLQTLVRGLLLQTALHTESSHLLLGASLTSLAISLISSISQGGGYNIREEAAEDWKSPSSPGRSVRIVRPLREVGIKECPAYAWWQGIRVIGKEKWPNSRQGIGGLTKEFIVGLEKDYPSTVSTITRTCAKLAPKDETTVTCVLCQRPAQLGLQQWKSRISIRSFESKDAAEADVDSLTPHLCYACHTTLTSKSSRGTMPVSSSSSSVPLPVWVQDRLGGEERELWRGKSMGEGDMKDAIGEFLLD